MRPLKNIFTLHSAQLLFVLGLLINISSCHKDSGRVDYNKLTELKLKSNFHASLYNSGLSVKSMENLVPDTHLGIFLSEKDIPLIVSGNYFNSEKTVNSDGSLSGTPVMMVIGKSYDIYSYAPYHPQSKASPIVESFEHGEDVIWSGKITIEQVSETNNRVNLEFEHLASQISFAVNKLNNSTEFSGSSYIKVAGFHSVAHLDVSSGVLTPHTGDLLMASASASEGKLGLNPFCFFNRGTNSMEINIEIFDGVKKYYGTIIKVFNSGESYKYTITIPGTQPELIINASLTPWIETESEITIGN